MYEDCKHCGKSTEIKELDENAKYGTYYHEAICNSCASDIDALQDSQQQDKNYD